MNNVIGICVGSYSKQQINIHIFRFLNTKLYMY